jgi:hypothetical protein
MFDLYIDNKRVTNSSSIYACEIEIAVDKPHQIVIDCDKEYAQKIHDHGVLFVTDSISLTFTGSNSLPPTVQSNGVYTLYLFTSIYKSKTGLPVFLRKIQRRLLSDVISELTGLKIRMVSNDDEIIIDPLNRDNYEAFKAVMELTKNYHWYQLDDATIVVGSPEDLQKNPKIIKNWVLDSFDLIEAVSPIQYCSVSSNVSGSELSGIIEHEFIDEAVDPQYPIVYFDGVPYVENTKVKNGVFYREETNINVTTLYEARTQLYKLAISKIQASENRVYNCSFVPTSIELPYALIQTHYIYGGEKTQISEFLTNFKYELSTNNS